MKKAIIVTKHIKNFEIGSIIEIGKSSEINKLRGNNFNRMSKVVIPAELEDKPISNLLAAHVSDQDSYYSDGANTVLTYEEVPQIDDGNGNMIVDESYIFYPSIPAHWEIQINPEVELESNVTVMYNTMRDEVYTQMKEVFATDDSGTALTYKETWTLMSTKPNGYTGLKSRFDLTSFSKGDSLDTNKKVKDYANECLERVDAYSIFIMQRVQKFRNDRDTLLGV